MKSTDIDLMIKLNKRGLTLREISKELGYSWQYVSTSIKKDPRYVPGKRGFARLSEEKRREVQSRGGTNAHKLGVAHTWNSKEARAASLKRTKIKKQSKK